MRIRVALVNDDEVVVQGLNAMLRAYDDQIEVAQMQVGAPVTVPVDIALFDTFAVSQGNSKRVQMLVSNPMVCHVVVYTWNFQPWLTKATLGQGVRGYLSKSLPADQIVQSLVAIHAGNVVVSPASDVSSWVGGDWPGKEVGLTARESEVLTLIALGMSNQEIAEQTVLSINSVKSYIRSAYRRIGVDSRSKAVLWGLAHGMGAHREPGNLPVATESCRLIN